MRYFKNKKILIILIVYLIINLFLQGSAHLYFYNYINPIFWSCFLFYLIYYLKDNYVRETLNKKQLLFISLFSLGYALFYFYVGFIFGFTKSPYGHDIGNIITNIFQVIVPVIGIEISRWVLIGKNTNNKMAIFITTLILILLEIRFYTIFSLTSNMEGLFKYCCSLILPLIASGCLSTYLVLNGSYKLSLIYRLLDRFLIILLPIFPDLDWFVSGIVGILTPTIIYVIFKFYFSNYEESFRKRKKTIVDKVIYFVTLAGALTLFLFMIGFFKYEVIAIVSNSMLPTYSRGDVVIYEKMDNESLKKLSVNSIIVYRIDNQYVVHRIVEKKEENGEVSYITKGDNNNSRDYKPVSIEQIKGVYSFSIKYLGFPSVWLNDFFNNEKAVVETK